MIRPLLPAAALCCAIALSACHRSDEHGGHVVDSVTEAFAGIGEDETIHFTGTEPFWGGEVASGQLRYTTPDDPQGAAIAVNRFAGNNGLGFSGELDGQRFHMAVTPGKCSDGMSDRLYPYVVTLDVHGEQREGCAWTDKQKFEGPQTP